MYEMGDAEIQAVQKVILSKKLFRYQAHHLGECDLFEKEFSEKLDVKHSIILSSGTNALVAALKSLGIGKSSAEGSDEVLIPAYTFVATAAAVVLAGAVPVVVNVDQTLGISLSDCKKKITAKTRAIIPVHMDGLAADMEGVTAFARVHNLDVIEDCAQALGGSFKGRRLGSWGDVGIFSLNENKNISCGEGGIVSTSKSELYKRMFGWQDLSAFFNPVKKSLFNEVEPFLGMSMRVSEIQGAIMRVQLTRLDDIIVKLRERKQIFINVLTNIPKLEIIYGNCAEGDCSSSLHIQFQNPVDAVACSKVLISSGIIAAFPTLRPAHVAWKWIDFIDPKNASKVKFDLNSSMQILMRILKYDLDPSLTFRETELLALKMRDLILRPN